MSISNVAPTSCVVAEKLLIIENRLRTKAYGAAKNNCMCAAYGEASLEVARESLAHFRECGVCQRELEAA